MDVQVKISTWVSFCVADAYGPSFIVAKGGKKLALHLLWNTPMSLFLNFKDIGVVQNSIPYSCHFYQTPSALEP